VLPPQRPGWGVPLSKRVRLPDYPRLFQVWRRRQESNLPAGETATRFQRVGPADAQRLREGFW